MSKKIYISAGHGINGDPGAVGIAGTRIEADDNLTLSIAVEQAAKNRGYQTRMARTVKNLIGSFDRIRDATNWGADCYIEIHRNGSNDPTANGWEIWTSRNPSSGSTALANAINKRTIEAGVQSQRGIKKNTRNVDRMESLNPHMPCVLTEHGFVNNTRDNQLFDQNLSAYANAIVTALDDVYGAVPAPQNPTEYRARVQASALNIRKGAGVNFDIAGMITDNGVYTIVEERDGLGAGRWGRLKSGVGWIALDFCERL